MRRAGEERDELPNVQSGGQVARPDYSQELGSRVHAHGIAAKAVHGDAAALVWQARLEAGLQRGAVLGDLARHAFQAAVFQRPHHVGEPCKRA